MAKELKLKTPAELRDWLKDKPASWSHIIAIRIALRMLPMIGRTMKLTREPRGNDYRASLVTSVFRACCLSWTEHRFPSRDTKLAAVDASAAAADAARAADAYAARAANTYAARAANVAYAAGAANVADAADAAGAYAYAAARAADASILKQIAHDAAWLEAQGKADNSRHAARLAEQPLWHENAPQSLRASREKSESTACV